MRERAETIEANACRWVSRLDRGLDTEERAALSAWLAADNRHCGAFARAQAAWRDLDRAQVFQIAEELRQEPTLRAKQRMAPARRNSALAMGAAAVLLLVASLAGWYFYSRNAVSTLAGEVRQWPLPDGSRVILDARSRIRVRFTRSDRIITLESGRALFEVAKDAARPFIVDAGQLHVRAVGTAFLVSLESASQAAVTVTKGTVQVWSDAELTPQPLRAGGHVAFDRGKIAAPEELTSQEMDRLVDWRAGIIDLDGKTLAQAVEELNRNSKFHVVVPDSRLASEPLVGEVSDSDPEAFAEAAAAMLGAHVRRDGNQLILEPGTKKY